MWLCLLILSPFIALVVLAVGFTAWDELFKEKAYQKRKEKAVKKYSLVKEMVEMIEQQTTLIKEMGEKYAENQDKINRLSIAIDCMPRDLVIEYIERKQDLIRQNARLDELMGESLRLRERAKDALKDLRKIYKFKKWWDN
jgi:DNA-binding Xre family transcriptional regulator